MRRSLLLAALLTAAPALAQQPTGGTSPPTAPSPATGAAPAASAGTAGVGVQATTSNPNLAVATVRLTNGWRASKLIGSPVFNAQNQKVGTIADLIITRKDHLSLAVVSVGGFLGMGSKLVAVPYGQLRFTEANNTLHVEMPGATKAEIAAMPSLVFEGD